MKIFVSLLLLLFLPLISYAQNNLYLCLLDKNGKILFKTEINQNSQFGIRFIHSVAKTPVEDWFSVQNGHIYLEKTIYHDFGAGLPYKPNQNQNMKFTDDKIIISGYHTKCKPSVNFLACLAQFLRQAFRADFAHAKTVPY